MEGDDAIESVIGMEGTLTFETTLVRLDAGSEQERSIDGRMTDDRFEHVGNCVPGFPAGEIDGIVPTPTRRQQVIEDRAEIFG